MYDWARFHEPKLLPRDAFYRSLNDEGITDRDYYHEQKVFSTFRCKTTGYYHDLYLRTDVLILADVFENFRKTCIETYRLNKDHYYTSPGLSWDASLKNSGVELELLIAYDMHLFRGKGMQSVISMVSRRYGNAKNPHIKGHNPDKSTIFI